MERPRDTEFYHHRARQHGDTIVWDAVSQPVSEARSIQLVSGLLRMTSACSSPASPTI